MFGHEIKLNFNRNGDAHTTTTLIGHVVKKKFLQQNFRIQNFIIKIFLNFSRSVGL